MIEKITFWVKQSSTTFDLYVDIRYWLENLYFYLLSIINKEAINAQLKRWIIIAIIYKCKIKKMDHNYINFGLRLYRHLKRRYTSYFFFQRQLHKYQGIITIQFIR